jgi:hypothetical protein
MKEDKSSYMMYTHQRPAQVLLDGDSILGWGLGDKQLCSWVP